MSLIDQGTKGYFAAWGKTTIVSGLLCLAVLTLSGCFEPDPIDPVSPTATVYFPAPTKIPTQTPKPTPVTPDFPMQSPNMKTVGSSSTKSCVICHTGPNFLEAAAEEDRSPTTAWEKVLIGESFFDEIVHARYGCATCHGGQGDTVFKAEAHQDLVRDPDATSACGACHANAVTADQTNLHTRLTGFQTALAARSAPDKMARLESAMDDHCTPCHATCGQCHISRPAYLGSGLVAGHQFSNLSLMDLTCSGCHGSRTEDEYKGQEGGVPGDVHWTQGRMDCAACHSADEMHGTTGALAHRYDGPPTPGCQDRRCHPDVAVGDGIQQHDSDHLGVLSCQACHATAYKNCYSCHVTLKDGTAHFEMEPLQMAFKIGRNPLQSPDRPWEYVPVRHVPVDRDTFSFYGQDLLSNFDAVPTWKYATPHNIQRITPQNQSCGSCHGNAAVFLTSGDVAPDERRANENVIVRNVPN